MLIAKVGLTVLFATAGLWLLSAPPAPAVADSAQAVQSTTYEEFVRTMNIDNLIAAQAEF